MQNPPTPQRHQVNLVYVDHPEISETFIDSIEKLIVDGPTVRLELVVNRPDNPSPPLPPTGKKHTACRIVMPITSLAPLVNQLNQVMGALAQQGLTHARQVTTPPPGKPN